MRAILADLGLRLSEAKIEVVDLGGKGRGIDFLGFHHRRVESFSRKGRTFCARWPSDKAVRRATDRIRRPNARRLLRLPVGVIVARVNEFLQGWRSFFGQGNSTTVFHSLDRFAVERVARFISNKHGHARNRYGYPVLRRNDYLGLSRLVGTVRSGPARVSR